MYLKILSMKGVVIFGKKSKLSPLLLVPMKSCKGFCKVAYELKLPSELVSVHPVFHVSILKKYIGYCESVLPIEGLGVKDNLSYEKVRVEILDRQIKRLSKKKCPP